MAITTAIYARYSDEAGHLGTASLGTGTADANYPVANVLDLNPANPFLTSSSGTAVDIDIDLGSAKTIYLVSIHGHNIPAGTDVRAQRGASSGASTVDDAVVIPTVPLDGLPLPVGVDLSATAASYRYFRLHIPSLAQKVGVGAIGLWTAKRTDLQNVLYPVRDTEQEPTVSFQTAYGARRAYALGARLRSQPASFLWREAVEYAALLALFRDARGSAHPFLWWRDPIGGSDAWLSVFADDNLERAMVTPAHSRVDTVIQEVGMGVALPTS